MPQKMLRRSQKKVVMTVDLFLYYAKIVNGLIGIFLDIFMKFKRKQ